MFVRELYLHQRKESVWGQQNIAAGKQTLVRPLRHMLLGNNSFYPCNLVGTACNKGVILKGGHIRTTFMFPLCMHV